MQLNLRPILNRFLFECGLFVDFFIHMRRRTDHFEAAHCVNILDI